MRAGAMRYREFGPTGREVSVIGQGTWKLERQDPRAAVDAIRAGVDAGMAHVDTAEIYGDGQVEALVGEALNGRREGVFLTSKVSPSHASRQGTIESCERSLRRLKTDRLECYLLHWPSSFPLEETVAAFQDLRAAGKILSWGLSNFSRQELDRVISLVGEGQVACDQVLYHLEERAVEHKLLDYCRAHRIALVAYSPFGSGRFPSVETEGGRMLDRIARDHDATAHQVALAFLVLHPTVFAIPRTVRPDHARENGEAAHLELSPDELAALDRAFRCDWTRPGVPTR